MEHFDYKMIPSAIILISIMFAIGVSVPSYSIVLPISLSYATTIGSICVIVFLIIPTFDLASH